MSKKAVYKYGGYNTGDERTDFELTRAECAEHQQRYIEIEKMVADIERKARISELERLLEFMMSTFNPEEIIIAETADAVRTVGIMLNERLAELKGDNNETK